MSWVKRAPIRFAVILIVAIWSLPTTGLFVSSFRPQSEVATSGWWTVFSHPFEESSWTVSNYSGVLDASGLWRAFGNSVVITLPATVIPITIAALAAYAFAWMRFRGRRTLFAIVILLLVVPIQMTLVPLLRLYTRLDLSGTYVGTWLAHAGFGLPLAVYLLYNYISSLPRELMESARIDGATHWDIFRRLVIPLSTPALASFAIFQFLWVWNDLLVSLVFLGTDGEVATLIARLNELVGSRGEAWHILTAGAFVSMAVPLVVFLSLQRFFVRGMLAGSVKG
ncbi:MAG: carbohydrate ABC transporter permease [Actinomycetia bacterium]|nr:carbohydrate ABC transporter permease [Actinomycetes bacterium]